MDSRSSSEDVAQFDFGQLDRISKSQLRALHLMHEGFVRNLAASLSAYLRSYVVLNLVSLSQISYAEFVEGLESPTCLAYIGMPPYEGTAVLEVDLTLMFSLIELLLGSKARSTTAVQRTITDIEKNLIKTLLRVMLRDLSEAWKTVAEISFGVQSLASEPQLQHVLAHGDAVVVIAVEMRVGTFSGVMNLAIPSILVKRLRHKFDQVRQVRRADSSEKDQQRLKQLMEEASVSFEARLNAGTISARTLLELDTGDTLVLEQATDSEISGLLNGQEKWRGKVVSSKDKFFFDVNTALVSRAKSEVADQPT